MTPFSNRIDVFFGLPSSAAALRTLAAGTPVTFAVFSGVYLSWVTTALSALKLAASQRASMNAWSWVFDARITFISELSSTTSVFGLSWRCTPPRSSAFAAGTVRRGSMTTFLLFVANMRL